MTILKHVCFISLFEKQVSAGVAKRCRRMEEAVWMSPMWPCWVSNGRVPAYSSCVAPTCLAEVKMLGMLRDVSPCSSQMMLSQLQLVAFSRSALLQAYESLPDGLLAIQLQKTCKGSERFMSEWYFYLYGIAQTLK